MDDGREGLTDIDRAIAQALDVDPSAEFLARVRQRVAREPMRIPLWRRRFLWIPIAAAAALLVTAVLTRPVKPTISTAPTRASRSPGAAAMQPALPGISQSSRRTAPPALRVPIRRVMTAASGSAKEPQVLVPREEIEMYRRLIAGAQGMPDALVVEAPPDIAANRTFADITIDPITIDLITPPEGREGVRQ